MPIDPTLITLAEVVRRAAAIVDPDGEDAAVAEFEQRYEDDDQPVRGLLDRLPERVRWGADDDPPVVVAQALVLYLAHRLDQFEDDPEDLLVRATRAEFSGEPPEAVADWLADQGIDAR